MIRTPPLVADLATDWMDFWRAIQSHGDFGYRLGDFGCRLVVAEATRPASQ